MANGGGQNDVKKILEEFGESKGDPEADMSDAVRLDEAIDMLTATHQIYTAAMISRFTEVQAMSLASAFFVKMLEMSAEANRT